MLYAEYDPEAEMAIVRAEALEEGRKLGREQALEEGHQYVLELLDQGLTIQEIKQRLTQPAGGYIVR
jgi:predicted transposase YdaD